MTEKSEFQLRQKIRRLIAAGRAKARPAHEESHGWACPGYPDSEGTMLWIGIAGTRPAMRPSGGSMSSDHALVPAKELRWRSDGPTILHGGNDRFADGRELLASGPARFTGELCAGAAAERCRVPSLDVQVPMSKSRLRAIGVCIILFYQSR